MKMNDYIGDFTKHLTEALEIGRSTVLDESVSEIHNVLICGLGGSGIGGTIVSDIISEQIEVPVCATKDYKIPQFVDENTLVIASSYSGKYGRDTLRLGSMSDTHGPNSMCYLRR